ncbi:MAG: immunoglobulin domain-containing protein [Phycisphaerales bacterium]|nr:immunoglobulin domain-containing protein [Phycisphaerales bacterium]
MATAATLCAMAGMAAAQPRLVSLGSNGAPVGVSANGTIVYGTTSGATRWTIGPNSITADPIAGASSIASCSDDGLFAVGTILNSGGLGGLATTATMTARWSSGPGWVHTGLFAANAGLGVTGSGVSSGSIHGPRDISGDGRFVATQGYIAPNGSFRYRGGIYDAQGNAGAGSHIVLPTSFNTTANRFRDGRCLAVSDDGMVVVGGEDPASSGGRLIFWRWNSGTNQYDMTYPPDGLNAQGNPQTRIVDNFHINAAGTIVVGTSFDYDTDTQTTDNYLARWTWDANTQSWTRTPLYNMSSQQSISSWWNNPGCPIPPNFIPTGMSDDGNTIVGILVYSTCGSFSRGGFIYTGGQMHDLYDWMNSQGTVGLSNWSGQFPSLGYPSDISPDGQFIVGFGGPQTAGGPGPGWIFSPTGGNDCVEPFITLNPNATLNFSLCSSFLLSAGAGGTGPLTYQWHKNGSPIFNGPTGSGSTVTGADATLFRITSPTPSDAGSYTCVITGPCGTPLTTTASAAQWDPAATTPSNDTCANPMVVNTGTNVLAPAQGICGAWQNDGWATCHSTGGSADLWFRWTATFSGNCRIDTCGATYDTIVSVFDQCNGSQLACNDNYEIGPSTGCSSSRSRAHLSVTQGTQYLIRVANASASSFSSYTCQLSINPAPAESGGNNCSSPLTAVLGTNLFDTNEATPDGFPSCVTQTSRDIWFSFTPPVSGRLRAATCPGTTWNTVLSIHDGCFGQEYACNDNASISGCSSQSIIDNLVVFANQTYLIRIGGNTFSTFGTGTLTLSLRCLGDFNNSGGTPDDADVTSFFEAWSTGDSSADVNGSGGTPDDADVAYFFELWDSGC